MSDGGPWKDYSFSGIAYGEPRLKADAISLRLKIPPARCADAASDMQQSYHLMGRAGFDAAPATYLRSYLDFS